MSQAGQEGHGVIHCLWFPFPCRRTAITQTWRMPGYSNQVQLPCCRWSQSSRSVPLGPGGLLLQERLFSTDPLCFPSMDLGCSAGSLASHSPPFLSDKSLGFEDSAVAPPSLLAAVSNSVRKARG